MFTTKTQTYQVQQKIQYGVGYAHLEGSGSIGNTTKLNSGNRIKSICIDNLEMYC